MSVATAVLPLLHRREKISAKPHPRTKFPIENTLLFALALAFYIVIANYFVFHLHYLINDAYARIDNAFDVLFTRDPHLAAIGFVWPPLPSFLMLPIIAFKGFWPALVTKGFAGSIEAAIFSAGTVVLFNSGLKWAGVVRGMRWVFCLAWMINPMIFIYAAQGMAEASFIFFFTSSILVFLRWCDSRRASLLPLMGLLAGLGCLCRVEMFVVTLFLGICVVVRTVRWRVSWREVETAALLYALPAILMIMLWVGSMAIIMRDPLFFIHAQSPVGATNGGAPHPTGLINIPKWADSVKFVATHSILLFPAIIPAVLMLGARLLMKRNRLPGIMLLALGTPVALVDVYELTFGGLSTTLRYQIFVIPFAFIVCVYVLRSLRSKHAVLSSLAALGMVTVLGLSNIVTAETVGDPRLSIDEVQVVAALTNNSTVEETTGPNAIDIGATIAPRVEALDTDHGLIACDSTTCFPIILNAANPKTFVVTSDRDFQAVAAQPQVYHVEYFLVQNSGRDELNLIYPGLWEDGGGFSVRVGDVGGGWRLYRITGPTGRG
jgi:hypothetical protein